MNTLTLRALAAELDTLRDRRLDRIHTPDDRTFTLEFEGGSRVVLVADPAHDTLYPLPGIADKPSGESPTSRSLQRVLAGARFDGATLAGLDRVVALRFLGRDRLGEPRGFTLVAELLGPGVNLILTEGREIWGGRILDRLRPDRSRSKPRLLKSGIPYRLPEHDRADLVLEGEAALVAALDGIGRPWTAAALTGAWAGMTAPVARMLMREAGAEASAQELVTAWRALLGAVLPSRGKEPAGERFRPCLVPGKAGGDVWPCLVDLTGDQTVKPGSETPGTAADAGPATSGKPMESAGPAGSPDAYETFDTVGEALAAAHRAFREGRKHQARGGLDAALKRAHGKATRALDAVAREQAQDGKAAELRRKGEAILAHADTISRGEASTRIPDPKTGEPMTVKLNPALTPHENADLYFKKARKAGRSGSRVGGRTRELEERRAALAVLARELAQGPPDDAWLERARALGVDLPGAQAARVEKTQAPEDRLPGDLRPRRYQLDHGWEVLVGRSNKGNDILTHEIARPHDIWMHAESVPGSHLVLRHSEKGKEPPQNVLLAAAAIAAWFSKAKHSGKVPVTITEKRHVRRPRKAPAGQAMVGEHKTLIVPPRNPDERQGS